MSAVVVRVAASTPCPPGFSQQGMATRRTKLCVKQSSNPASDVAAAVAVLPAPAPAPAYDPSVDDLVGLLGTMTMNQPYAVDMDQLSSLMGASSIGGRRHRRNTKKARKTRRRRL
jgi:hypothetical protein